MKEKVHRIVRLALAAALVLGTAKASEGASREWLTRFDDALAAAEKGDRYILIDMWAEWCGWCRELNETVFQSAEFQAFAKDFVLLRVDTMDKGEGSTLQKAYGVEKLPTTVVVNSDRVRVGSLMGMFETPEYIAKLRQEIDKYERFVRFYDRVKTSDKVEIQRKLATELHERGDGLRAAGLYEKIGETVAPGSEEKAWLTYHTADAYRIGRDLERARSHAAKARDLASGLGLHELAEQAQMLGYYIARNEGDCAAAKASLEKFLERFPESGQRFEVRRTLRELRRGDVPDCRM